VGKVLSLRLKDDQMERLGRIARAFTKKPSETAAQLLEEAMRREEYPSVEIRGTIAGREAFVGSSRLRVMDVVLRARGGQSAGEIAKSLGFHETQIQGALAYAARYEDEIDAAIADADAAFDRLFPDAKKYRETPVDATAP
jgi:uncharacterized protein (DUF433 family)